jgi:exodeoxyribonuclease VII small subunit
MTKKIDYQTLSAELDAIMAELQKDNVDVDDALKHYERGLELVKQLETYLQSAENKITELKATYSPE